ALAALEYHVIDRALAEEPLAARLAQFGLVVTVGEYERRLAGHADIELVPIGPARCRVAVDFAAPGGDSVAARGYCGSRFAFVEAGEQLPENFRLFPDRIAPGHSIACPVEYAVFGESVRIGFEVAPVHREQVSALEILDLGAVVGVVAVVFLCDSQTCQQ